MRIKLPPEEYHDLIWSVYKRDGYKCRSCGWRNDMAAHHVIYRSHQGPDAKNNLITLCASCHRGHHDGFLKITIVKILESDIIVKFERVKGWRPR